MVWWRLGWAMRLIGSGAIAGVDGGRSGRGWFDLLLSTCLLILGRHYLQASNKSL